MKFWERKRDTKEAGRGVAQAALDGASRVEIVSEALRELQADGADRVGIWLASESESGLDAPATLGVAGQSTEQKTGGTALVRSSGCVWRGVVWDREGESTPVEWQQLSGEALLPSEVVFAGRSVEQELGGGKQSLLISILMDLRKVLWVPIGIRGGLQGVILCGARDERSTLPLVHAQHVAAELALHLLREEERGVARVRSADMDLTRRVHAELESGANSELVLAGLADSIVSGEAVGVGAAFASIGILPENGDTREGKREIPPGSVEFRWKSGDQDLLRMAEGAAASETWQKALRDRHAVGTAPQSLGMHATVARIVAAPIEAGGEPCGVLLAGLYQRGASLASLERLQYRASLAGLAMAKLARERKETRIAERERAGLAATRERLLLLDERGCVAALSSAAAELLTDVRAQLVEGEDAQHTRTADAIKRGAAAGAADGTSAGPTANGNGSARPFQRRGLADFQLGSRLESLFRAADRRAVEKWRLREAQTGVIRRNAGEDALDAELCNGVKVRLRTGLPSALSLTVISLTERDGQEAVTTSVVNNEKALEGVIEWLEEGVVLFDAQENVRAHNTRFEQLVGLGPLESAKGETL
ncbi:MAG TPA: hypothetical protein VE545_05130, partial [Candidatus Dormibacteraeota bacterium]|nr:hypothetical protein [Candidatus Dormibacteraeota bacterium]